MTREASVSPAAAVELASKTDVGQVRSANEDSCDSVDRADGSRLLVVADGMGGHRGGATASQTAVATISEVFQQDTSDQSQDMLRRAIEAANARIYSLAQDDPELEGMGTTVVAFLLDPRQRGSVAHVGDSRAYRYRRGRLEPLTIDHSVVAEMHRRGLLSAEEAATHPRRNEILRSVGVLPEVEVETADVEVSPGDRFVLCSDGLSGVVSDEEIAAIVQSKPPEAAVEALVELANERGGPDNITVQILLIPASEDEGDPEATAPVELSAVGIEAIETKRRERERTRRISMAGVALLGVIGLVLLWQLLRSPGAEPESARDPQATAPGPDATGSAPAFEDRFEVDGASPRHGIQR
jgi:protein phosphatase